MLNKKASRVAPFARQTRVRINLERVNRLSVHRTNPHIYASIISPEGDKVLVSASTAGSGSAQPADRRQGQGRQRRGGEARRQRLAEKAKAAGVETVAFDRAGFRYHGRVKALADAAREAGLKF